jgi:hypothetical protein
VPDTSPSFMDWPACKNNIPPHCSCTSQYNSIALSEVGITHIYA